ncbi:unnamed protein product [Cunninghamella echinulata]
MTQTMMETTIIDKESILSYHHQQQEESTRRRSFQFSTRSLKLATIFNYRRSSLTLNRFSLPSLSPSSSTTSSTTTTAIEDEPLSPKQLEIEQLIADYPERTVRLSVTPDFAI